MNGRDLDYTIAEILGLRIYQNVNHHNNLLRHTWNVEVNGIIVESELDDEQLAIDSIPYFSKSPKEIRDVYVWLIQNHPSIYNSIEVDIHPLIASGSKEDAFILAQLFVRLMRENQNGIR